jgi:hypothetical protein
VSIIESLRNYISTYPNLKTFDDILKVFVDYSNNENATTYSIEEGITSNPIIKRYTVGSTVRQYLFTFSSIEFYGSDVQQNIDNCGFYEDFADWLENNTKNKILPILTGNRQAISVEVLTNGYLFGSSEDMTTARYQVQLRLKYFQE